MQPYLSQFFFSQKFFTLVCTYTFFFTGTSIDLSMVATELDQNNIFSRWQSTFTMIKDLANYTEFLFALLQFVSVMIIFMKFFNHMHKLGASE